MADTKPASNENWFDREVFRPRIVSSLLRSVIFQFVTLFGFLMLQSADFLLHPVSRMGQNFASILSPTSWFYDLVAVAGVVAIGLMYSRQLEMSLWVPRNNLAILERIFEPKVMTSLAAHFAVGGVLLRSYLGLLGGQFNSLMTTCRRDGVAYTCFNTPHIFIVLSGCFHALEMWREFHFGNGNVLDFPLVEQSGNSQLSRRFGSMARHSLKSVFFNMRWFYGFYILVGYRVANVLSEVFSVDISGSSHLLTDSIYEHFLIFWQSWLLNSLVTFSIRLLRAIIGIYLTKRWIFAIPGENSLVKAMKSKNGLMQSLAFYDFYHLTSSSKLRRAELFTLSQPGGHPHNWNEICQACCAKIDDFVKKLANSTAQAETGKKPENPVLYSTANTLDPVKVSAKDKEMINIPARKPAEEKFPGKKFVENFVRERVNRFPVKVLKAFREKFANNWLVSAAPDAATRAVFVQCQTVIWAVEGLSFLVASSINEDRFGVVQKDMANILVAFLSLQQTVEKHKGITVTARKNRFETRDLQLKQELRVAIKSSLYRICIVFGDHMKNIALPSEYQKKMSNFQNFVEA